MRQYQALRPDLGGVYFLIAFPCAFILIFELNYNNQRSSGDRDQEACRASRASRSTEFESNDCAMSVD